MYHNELLHGRYRGTFVSRPVQLFVAYRSVYQSNAIL